MVNNLKPTISNINYYLPKVDYSNDKIIKKPKNIGKIIKKVGINKKFAADKNEFASDLAIKSISKLFYKNPSLKKGWLEMEEVSPAEDAYMNGDSKKAFKILKPLAEKGNSHVLASPIQLATTAMA